MSKSAIEWTDDTWNPVSGCTRVSAGCDNCYAVTMTKRLEAMGQEKYSGLVNIGKGHFNGVVKCHEDALTIPLKAKKPRRYFVNSMSDLFHKEVPFEFIDKVFAAMALCPQHTFQILTKRPERMAEYLNERRSPNAAIAAIAHLWAMERGPVLANRLAQFESRLRTHFHELVVGGPSPLPNVWLGTSCEDQSTADERIPHLLKCPAAVRFLSCEPLLGPVDVICSCGATVSNEFRACEAATEPNRIHWVIVGGESGPSARPMHPEWARSLRDQCVKAGVSFFFKQWGEWLSKCQVKLADGSGDFLPHVTRETICAWGTSEYGALTANGKYSEGWTPFSDEVCVRKVGKKAAGRILDGRTWDEYPVVTR